METLANSARKNRAWASSLLFLLLACTMVLSACGGSAQGAPPINLTLSGNWQFTMAPPADGSFLGGLQGGFLLQSTGSVTGAAAYAVSLPDLLVPCSTGSAQITGTVTSQGVALTAVAGTQTFALSGALGLDGETMAGTYASTAGTAGDGSPCGTAQTGLQWSAILVPPLTGSIQGSFHSAGGVAGLNEQDFLVSGALTQAANTGASNASVTGNLNFLNTLTNTSDYPCIGVAAVYGQISGNSVTLQIVAPDGSELGLIGEPAGSLGSTGVNPVTFDPVHGGYILHGAGPSYLVSTPLAGMTPCPGSLGNVDVAGDFGNICLGLNGASACQQPITLTPSALIFPQQVEGAPPATLDITLANASGSTLGGLTLALANTSGATNYTETDECGVDGVPSQGEPFDLESGQSCVVTINFAPLETCAPGTPPSQCPSPLNATLTVTSPSDDIIFSVPITGVGLSEGEAFANPILHSAHSLPLASRRTSQDVEPHAEI